MIPQLLKYGVVGALNTAITFIVIAALTSFEINPYLTNALGFIAGLLNSYLLNSRFTFNQKSSSAAALKFSLSFAIAYLLNVVVLHYLISLTIIPTIAAQFFAMASYNIAFFILMKTWVFTRDQ